MEEINASIDFDRKLYRQDIRGLARPCRDAGRYWHPFGRRPRQDHTAVSRASILSEIEAGQLLLLAPRSKTFT
jgi:hypothetical protein